MQLPIGHCVILDVFEILMHLARKQLVFPHPCLTPPSEGTPCGINLVYTPLTNCSCSCASRSYCILHCVCCLCSFLSFFFCISASVANKRVYNTGLSSLVQPLLAPQIYDIPLNSERIRSFRRSRSPKGHRFDVNRKRTCDFLLVSSNFGRISYRFRDTDIEIYKMAYYPPLPWLTPQLGRTCQNFWMRLIPQKLEVWGYHVVIIS